MATRICKVCGKEYEYCHTQRTVPGIFRYQDVACCAEHGSIYLARVLAARSEDNKPELKPSKKAEVVEADSDASVLDYEDIDDIDDDIDDDDDWFDDDEEDEDDN